ncbi:DUF1015 domain-containing protein [Ruminococcus sp. Marseille-P6503]|uniref:DUF1015 domain-containing protein n=1 Tax=Ruminococcus sp. Marseille-P6503 TaxID=2364796 RepID=UPI000F52DDFD|nr:DUF1015 domain-containing protein [Ruminococcus sp. Marseille-P6503]
MSTAFKKADILLPKNTDMSKWAVVACDQYTSQPEYWLETEKLAAGSKSALNLILPEVYLESPDVDRRIEKIHNNMTGYLETDTFEEFKNSLIYIERTQSDGKVRAGIVGAIDLEEYDYRKGSRSQVRATEATVIERIPPRVKVREGARIELPHIMLLIDDAEKAVIEPLAEKTAGMKKLYDFTLMQKGGSIKGWLIDDKTADSVLAALEKLADLDTFNKKYGVSEDSSLVYAMGDGNHSLASAKEFYERLKAQNPDKDMSRSPARYALAEIVDLHSPALEFEAIHRIVTGVDAQKLEERITEELELSSDRSGQKITIVKNGVHTEKYVHKPLSKLAVGSLQTVLDRLLPETGGKIDYIHGADVVDRLSMKEDTIGFILPDMAKSELFPTVVCDGALPRKTFSMGHAEDKRFYIEARRIAE